MSEPRDFQFATQPSLRPIFMAESTEHARVEWSTQPDGREVRFVSWLQTKKHGPPPEALEQWAESGWVTT